MALKYLVPLCIYKNSLPIPLWSYPKLKQTVFGPFFLFIKTQKLRLIDTIKDSKSTSYFSSPLYGLSYQTIYIEIVVVYNIRTVWNSFNLRKHLLPFQRALHHRIWNRTSKKSFWELPLRIFSSFIKQSNYYTL